MECVFFSGKKVNSNLLFVKEEKMIYKKKSTYKDVVKFQCWRAGCPARVNYMPNGTCMMPQKFVPHNHDHEEEEYRKLNALNKIKEESAKISGTLGVEPNAISSVRTAFRNVSEK